MATIKLKDENAKTFSIDGVCYTKGDYRLQYNAKKEVLIIPKAVANISNLAGLPFKSPVGWTYFIDANDNPYNSFEEFSLAISDAINFNLGEATPQQYKFLLSQSGVDDQQTATSGTLTQGVTYEIVAFETGDNFIPSGAPNNDVGTKWISNGGAPTWSNGSEIGWNNGTAVLTRELTPNTTGRDIYITSGASNGSTTIFPIGGDWSSVPIVELGAFNFDSGGDVGLINLNGVGVSAIGIQTTDLTGGTTSGVLFNTLVSITLYE